MTLYHAFTALIDISIYEHMTLGPCMWCVVHFPQGQHRRGVGVHSRLWLCLASTFTLRTISFEVIFAATSMALHHLSVRRLRIAFPLAAFAAEVRVVGFFIIVVFFIGAPSVLVPKCRTGLSALAALALEVGRRSSLLRFAAFPFAFSGEASSKSPVLCRTLTIAAVSLLVHQILVPQRAGDKHDGRIGTFWQ